MSNRQHAGRPRMQRQRAPRKAVRPGFTSYPAHEPNGKVSALAVCAGSWRGTSTLQDPENDLYDESSSSATVMPVLGGSFVRPDGREEWAVEASYARVTRGG